MNFASDLILSKQLTATAQRSEFIRRTKISCDVPLTMIISKDKNAISLSPTIVCMFIQISFSHSPNCFFRLHRTFRQDIKPCNYLTLSNGSCHFILDPHLHIPAALLPPLQPGQTDYNRPNFRLESHNENTTAEIWISPGPKSAPNTIEDVVLHEDPLNKLPLRMACEGKNCNLQLYIPRTFVGLIKTTVKDGNIQSSRGLQAESRMLEGTGSETRLFVGDIGLFEQEGWVGDELWVSCPRSNVHLAFEDEVRAHVPLPVLLVQSIWKLWNGGGSQWDTLENSKIHNF
ncbi:hypothetical protein DL96DRAFT_1599657 [Flagelloscypha sp. PMI_526]|nr:hypothetical protein DL96DRAFT_1599657 [Flagelloscypha sp. PMI_526]